MQERVLSAIWVGRCLAKRQARSCGMGLKKPESLRKVKKKATKTRRFARSGWQLFVHERSAGQKADFKLLGAEFKALPQEDRQRLEERARLSARHRGGDETRQFNAFRDPLRRALAKAAAARQEAKWEKTRKSLTDADRLDALFYDAIVGGQQGEAAVVAASKAARLDQRMVRKQNREVEQTLAEFRDKRAAGFLDAACNAAASLQPIASSLVPFPSRGAISFDLAPNTAEVARRAVDYAQATAKKNNLANALDLDWDRRTNLVCEAGLPLIADLPTEAKKALLCKKAGVCLCSDEGNVLRRFATAFLTKGLKPHTMAKTPNRDRLLAGRLFVGLVHRDPPPGRNAQVAALELGAFAPDRADVVWQHFGFVSLSPYKPTFQAMVPREGASAVEGGVPLMATSEFQDMYRLFQDFDFKRWWWAGLLFIWESEQPLGEFAPAHADVLPLLPPTLFWSLARRGSERMGGCSRRPETMPTRRRLRQTLLRKAAPLTRKRP